MWISSGRATVWPCSETENQWRAGHYDGHGRTALVAGVFIGVREGVEFLWEQRGVTPTATPKEEGLKVDQPKLLMSMGRSCEEFLALWATMLALYTQGALRERGSYVAIRES